MIKIGIPCGILTLIPVKIGYYLVRMDIQGALKTGYKFVSGASYWYMPCCIAAEIIFFIILKDSRKVSFVSVTIISVSACGFIMAKAGIGSFAQFRVACIAQIFMLFGYLFRNYEEKSQSGTFRLILGLCCTILYLILGVLTLVLYPGQCMDVHVCRYYSLPICLGMIVTGLIAVFLAFRKFYIRDGILSFIGKNTLVFYPQSRISCTQIHRNFEKSILNSAEMPILSAFWLSLSKYI